MIRIFLLCLAVLVNSFGLSAHEEPAKTLKEKLEKEKSRLEILKNGIISFTVWKHSVSDDKPDPILKDKFLTVIYDEKGNISEMQVFKSNDTLDYRVVFGYDEDNNMITDTDYNPDGTVAEKIEYVYDEKGRVKEQFNYLSGGKFDSKFTYDFGYDENILLFNKYKPVDSVEYQIIYKYDGDADSGNNTEIVKQKPGGSLIMRVENVFNGAGLRLQKRIFDEHNDLMYYFEYSYHGGGERFSSITKYSPENQLISKTVYALNGFGFYESVISSDEKGSIVSFTSYEYTTGR